MSHPTPGPPPESDRTGPAAPRDRALDALRQLDAELARLSRRVCSDAELRAVVGDFFISLRASTPHADGTTTLVVGTEAWARLQVAAGRPTRRIR